jgi:hypothetical protein
MATQPYRQIHLDFHTGPAIADVGSQWDADSFAKTMATANVESVTLFAKCHHGHLYYDSPRSERHPGLSSDLDLLREQVDALHAVGIRAPIYLSLLLDEYAALRHPEWVARRPDTSMVRIGDSVFSAGWHVMDMSTGYQEYFAEQVAEVLEVFAPVDGIFFDMCWDQPSVTHAAINEMIAAGLDPTDVNDRDRHAEDVAGRYMWRFATMVRQSSRDASVFFNSRPLALVERDLDAQEHLEIEALATGGWGYGYFPLTARRVRRLGKQYLGMTARFHKGWADFGGLKAAAALEYELAQMMAHGARCSIGDQLHPRGQLDPVAYELIGAAYARVRACEPWLRDAQSVVDMAVLQPTTEHHRMTGTAAGVVRMLTQLRHQFDIVGPAEPFEGYQVVVLADDVDVDASLRRRLDAFVAGGGRVLLTGVSGVGADLPWAGFTQAAMSEFTTSYFRFAPGLGDNGRTDHVIYDTTVQVAPAEDAVVLAHGQDPYFERAWDHFCSHAQTPPAGPNGSPVALAGTSAGYIAFPVFSCFAVHGHPAYRTLTQGVLDRLLPDPLLQASGPTGLETSVTRQADRLIVHLLYYPVERRASDFDVVEDVVPLHDLRLSVRLDDRLRDAAVSARLEPDGLDLEVEVVAGRAVVTVPVLRGHGIVVLAPAVPLVTA